MFEELTNRFQSLFKNICGHGKLTEANIADALREVRRSLLEADVNYAVVKEFVAAVEKKALGTEVLHSITPSQQFIKIVYDELSQLLGGVSRQVRFHTNRLNCIVVAGLQGSGKTTTCAKLGLYFRKQGHRPLLIACDTYRLAAIEQLESLGRSLDLTVYAQRNKRPLEICREGLAVARQSDYTMAIIDTAGRLHIDEEMMSELKMICQQSQPDEILFVADAMTGQDAVNAAATFHKEISFSGVVLTKMDGDARGGAALSIVHATGVPILFAGTSEKPDGLELFHPNRIASRILGMGDIVSLVEKTQAMIDREQAQKLERKIRRNAFTLNDFLAQIGHIKKMGSIGELLAMIPGLATQVKDAEVDQAALSRIEAIISSMTPQERERPMIIDGRRRLRIARGSGTTVQDVNKLLRMFDSMKTMMKRMNKMAGRRSRLTTWSSFMQ